MIGRYMTECPLWGVCSVQAMQTGLPTLAKESSVKTGEFKSLICAAFPYFAGCEYGDISLYARGRDYHQTVGEILERVCASLSKAYPENRFSHFVDIDPFDEVYAAACSGLGVVGENRLLITKKWGSYVFLGIIATDMALDGGQKAERCQSCGKCRSACPVGLDKNRCLSHLTQKRGELTKEEMWLLSRHPLVWGCDTCQLACPMNQATLKTHIKAFSTDLIYFFPEEDGNISDRLFRKKYCNRAFAWRGIAPIKRNLGLRSLKMNITIRKASEADFEDLLAIERACYPISEAATAESTKKRLAAYKTCYFVAEIEGKAVGLINGSILPGYDMYDELYQNIGLHDENAQWQSVFGLGVLPEHRRQGIAEALMNTLIQTARKNGKKGLFLDCKEHLVHYYEKFGYKKIGLSRSVLGGAVWYDMVLTF